MATLRLNTSVKYLKGVGPKRAEALARLGVRTVGDLLYHAPHRYLDATVGQNAVHQARAFAATVPLTGLIVTKLDGTAKGGSVVALERAVSVPIRFLGTGEGLDDLEVFDAQAYARRLVSG